MDSKIEKFLTKIGLYKKYLNDFEDSFFTDFINDAENNKLIVTIKNKDYLPFKTYQHLFTCCNSFIDFTIELSFSYEKENNINRLVEEFIKDTCIYKYQIYDSENKIIIHYSNDNIYKLDLLKDAKTLYKFLKDINSKYKVLTQELLYDDDTTLIDAKKEQEYISKEYYAKEENHYLNDNIYHLVKIKDITNYDTVTVNGKIFKVDIRKTKKNKEMRVIKFSDGEDATYMTLFESKRWPLEELEKFAPGVKVEIKGIVSYDKYNKNEICINPQAINILEKDKEKIDDAKEKRVELHLHTKMSTLDGVTDISEYYKRIKKLGHKAFGITDHGVVQSFPQAYELSKNNDVKILYGCEFYMVDDKRSFIYNPSKKVLKNESFVVFDTETTGLSCKYNRLIEFGAVKINSLGQVIDEIDFFIKPNQTLSKFSIEHSHISQMEADNGLPIKQALKNIKDFFGDSILVAHNASFDYDFINEALINNQMEKIQNPVIDTLELSRYLVPEIRSHSEDALARFYNIEFDKSEAHRANYDAKHLSLIFISMLEDLYKKENNHNLKHEDLLNLTIEEKGISTIFPNHVTVYAKDDQGIKDLYKLVSIASTKHISRDGNPVITRNELSSLRKNLILGSACFNGEVFEQAMTKGNEKLISTMQFYDFIEVQPPKNYIPLIYKGNINSIDDIKKILTDLITTAKSINKLVCATGDVHYFSKDEKIFRDVMIAAKGLKGVRHPLNFAPYESEKNQEVLNNWYNNPLPNPDQEFLTTSEMIEQFSFLNNSQLVKEIVITNTNIIADSISQITPITQGLHTPYIPNCEEALTNLVWKTAKEKYGDPLPELIKNRIDEELGGIVKLGYSVIFWLSTMIVKWTNEKGYIVGSRGSVGSSVVAMFAGITEVNALPPHYICPKCHNIEWVSSKDYASGFDLPPKKCPKCKHEYDRDGQNIPFQTFLDFKTNKVPDIDLNFPSDFQDDAMQHLGDKLNETGNSCYRAGTIQATQEKQAIGYVLGYFESLGKKTSEITQAQKEFLASGCIDIRRSTGQHPGGIIVIPKGMEIFDFTPYQYPANDTSKSWKTTHFEFKAIHDNVLKFDALAHIDPCVIKYMDDLCNFKFTSLSDLRYDVDITDPKVVSVFISPDALNLKHNYLKQETGALGLPEFGTVIGRKTLLETKPKSFADLVRICGLSHGTDVYSGNARDLILNENKTLSDVIACRDDIMITLSEKYGIDSSIAFNIMESVRKGKFNEKTLGDTFYKYIQLMKEKKVPEYYINSCIKIKYLFPKAHAVAYASMACRCAWFKIYRPKEYYAAFFTYRLSAYDYETMLGGVSACMKKIETIRNKMDNFEKVEAKEENLIDTLESTIEMYDRDIEFDHITIENSDSLKFIINPENGKLIPPFSILDGFGIETTKKIVAERNKRKFTSLEDLMNRSNLNNTQLNYLKKIRALDNLDEDEQIRLF